MGRRKLAVKPLEYKTKMLDTGCRYKVVTNDIIRKIHDGIYLPGEKLESVRTLAARYKIGRQIILSAFNELSRRGFIYSEAKRGAFVSPLLMTGRFYRLGFFIFFDNPTGSGIMIDCVYREALRKNYQVVMGTSHEGDYAFSEWLDRKRDIDGVLLSGYVTEDDLREVVKRRLPYMVMGNLDISPDHPQQRIDLVTGIHDVLLPKFSRFPGKRIGALICSSVFTAARQTAEGVRAAIADAGCKSDGKLIMHTEGDGYEEAGILLSELKPDVLYIHGDTYSGYSRYICSHKGIRRPYVIVNTNGRFSADKEICDESFFPNLYSEEVIRSAVDRLFVQIESVAK